MEPYAPARLTSKWAMHELGRPWVLGKQVWYAGCKRVVIVKARTWRCWRGQWAGEGSPGRGHVKEPRQRSVFTNSQVGEDGQWGTCPQGAHPPSTGRLCFSFKLGPPAPRFKQLSPWVPAPPLQLSVGWVLGTVRVPGPCQWGLTVTGGGSRHRPPEGTGEKVPLSLLLQPCFREQLSRGTQAGVPPKSRLQGNHKIGACSVSGMINGLRSPRSQGSLQVALVLAPSLNVSTLCFTRDPVSGASSPCGARGCQRTQVQAHTIPPRGGAELAL